MAYSAKMPGQSRCQNIVQRYRSHYSGGVEHVPPLKISCVEDTFYCFSHFGVLGTDILRYRSVSTTGSLAQSRTTYIVGESRPVGSFKSIRESIMVL